MDDQPPHPLSLPAHDRGYPGDDVREPSLPSPPPHPNEPADIPPATRKRSWLGSSFGLLLVLLIVGGLVAWVIYRAERPAPPTGRFQSAGPMPVGTAKVEKGDMPIILSALGTVTPLAVVTVKTQINGQLIEVAFREGQMVNKGDFLAQIDPRPYQVALEQAQGQLAKDQAALKNAQVDLARYKTLVAQNSIARQTLDTQAALVQQNIGTVQADQAQVDTQKLNLTYCRIVAPVGGRVGLRQVDQGNYVQTSDANGLVVITQLQPISVIFTLPEDNLPSVMRRTKGGNSLPVTAYDRTGATKLGEGKLQTIDNQIDTSTGTVKLRAIFDNPDQMLFPNQFVNVKLLVDTRQDASLVPTAAVQRGAPGTFVYVVEPDNTVTAQPVTLGPSDSQHVSITKGVQPGQTVVTDGADRLKDGGKVSLAEGGPAKSAPPTEDAAAGTQDQRGAGPAGNGQGGDGRGGDGRGGDGRGGDGQNRRGHREQGASDRTAHPNDAANPSEERPHGQHQRRGAE
jgi:multidrug efflux system membrane fusion protein